MRWIDLLLVTKSDWLQRKKRFAGFIHRLDLLFIAPRGSERAKVTIGGNVDDTVGHHGVVDAANKGVFVRSPAGSDCTDGNHISIAGETWIAESVN